MRTVMLVLLAGFILGSASGQDIYTYQQLQTRWATAENPSGAAGSGGQLNGSRKGRAYISLKAGDSATLAEAQDSSGTVRRIWITLSDFSPMMIRSLRIRFFWDGASKPAVDTPIGDFFSIPLGQMIQFESALFASPEGRSFDCFVPMPFRKSMKILVTNESSKFLGALFYEVDYTLGDQHGADMLYFHAWYHNENPTKLKQDFDILPRISGLGRFLGASIGVIADHHKYLNTWWGEGEVKIFTDNDTVFPSLNGTGTEDYIGTGFGMHQFSSLYQGCTLADGKSMRYGFYRLHVPDPIYFRTSIRVTIQQIGWGKITPEILELASPLYKPGPGLVELQSPTTGMFERQDDWSSVAYFYLDTPSDSLPPLEPVAYRIKEITSQDAQ